jgi:hypothetical protein
MKGGGDGKEDEGEGGKSKGPLSVCKDAPVLIYVCTAPAEHPLITTSVASAMSIRSMRSSKSALGVEGERLRRREGGRSGGRV